MPLEDTDPVKHLLDKLRQDSPIDQPADAGVPQTMEVYSFVQSHLNERTFGIVHTRKVSTNSTHILRQSDD